MARVPPLQCSPQHSLQVASAQVDSLERLADLEQFSTARLQLRKGALMSLRKDLEDARLTYPGITAQVCHLFACSQDPPVFSLVGGTGLAVHSAALTLYQACR